MTQDLAIGVTLLGIGAVLLFIGMPKHGVSPRFLRFEAALILYTPLILVFLALGAAEIISGLSH